MGAYLDYDAQSLSTGPSNPIGGYFMVPYALSCCLLTFSPSIISLSLSVMYFEMFDAKSTIL